VHDLTPPVYPLTVYQGDTGRWRIQLWLDQEKTQPADLEGVRIETPLTCGGSVFALSADVLLPNTVMLTLDAPVSALMKGNGNWALKLVKADSSVQTVLRGPVTVMADVTTNAPAWPSGAGNAPAR
jgi:hypothetical protein